MPEPASSELPAAAESVAPVETSPATRELTREEVGDFEGSEMLVGATVPVGKEAEEVGGQRSEVKEEDPPSEPEPTSDLRPPTPEPTSDLRPPTSEEEPAVPEPGKQQLEEITRERDELKAKIEAEKAAPITGPVATLDNPLADVSDDAELAARQALAEQIEDWADEHREGGELPRALQAALEGKKPEEITEPRDLSGDEARVLYRNAKKMLRAHIPARREWLQHARGNEQWMRSEFPEFWDKSHEKGQLFAEFERTMPQLKAIAKWPAALASMVEGHLALQAKYLAKAGQTKAATPRPEPPAAPVPPSTGSRGASASKPAAVKPRRETALSAAMTDEEVFATLD